jgi:16S rRNA (guanine527-N7)-methyltransferase
VTPGRGGGDDWAAVGDGSLVEVLEEARSLGFLGPGEVERHLEHARAFVDLIEDGERVLDLGSGGGVPGLVVAACCVDVAVTLVDARERATAFLSRSAARLGMDIAVVRGRAEELARHPDLRGSFDVVTSRSFGAPAVTAECAAGFLRPGGRLLVSEPPDSTDRWPVEGCARTGLVPGAVCVGRGATIRVLDMVGACPAGIPRQNGVPGRRPLW